MNTEDLLTGIMLPNSARLKQLIKEHGQFWQVPNSPAKPMQCFNGDLGFPITSENGKHFRNIRATDIKIS